MANEDQAAIPADSGGDPGAGESDAQPVAPRASETSIQEVHPLTCTGCGGALQGPSGDKASLGKSYKRYRHGTDVAGYQFG